jgi:hypothetical protein
MNNITWIANAVAGEISSNYSSGLRNFAATVVESGPSTLLDRIDIEHGGPRQRNETSAEYALQQPQQHHLIE